MGPRIDSTAVDSTKTRQNTQLNQPQLISRTTSEQLQLKQQDPVGCFNQQSTTVETSSYRLVYGWINRGFIDRKGDGTPH